MTAPTSPDDRPDEHLIRAYDQMLERTRAGLDPGNADTDPAAGPAAGPAANLRELLDRVRDSMVELGELTREEAQRIADYIQRDIEDAAEYIVETGEDLRAWWRFDLDLIERRMLDAFSLVADQTSLNWSAWADRARRASLYQAGQITGPGTLACDRCGAETHFTRTGRIPPCADCGGLEFRRVGARE